MTRRTDDDAQVVIVACLIEDRTNAEQRAMLRVALRLDLDGGSFAHSNKALIEPSLVDLVTDSWRPEVPPRAALTGPDRKAYDRLVAKWSRCVRCRLPLGLHLPQGCPFTERDDGRGLYLYGTVGERVPEGSWIIPADPRWTT